jgi:SpoVK/Ycf46/Vps4 family AAA+-type ATPase
MEEPPLEERVEQWRAELGPLAVPLNGHLEQIADQFRLPSTGIAAAARELALEDSSHLADSAWRICRERARGGLEELARRIPARATWDDLVLPEPQLEMLRALVLQVRHRCRVFEQWGFSCRPGRSPGVTALFSGPSGSGKTLGAEVLAADLQLDLYRIDLSSTVSKYIGETEKNLKRIFDAAEASGAILLFDEADALFGKRSEVKDSHDRFANLEISYLLQRMEAYRGLAILTTNLKGALDTAFLRRLRFHVQFPFPAPAERERIWQRAFPAEAPIDGLDWGKLSRLAVAGGNIANIALGAAFRAANESSAVTMRHVLAAARAECAKIEKPLAENEVRGWV